MLAADIAARKMSVAGEVVLQASAVAVGGRGVLLLGKPGSGKSTLALSLIDRGAILIGDDGVCLRDEAGQLVASPPPNIRGKLEIRGVGIVDLPCCTAPVAIAIALDRDGERLPQAAEKLTQFDMAIPLIALGEADMASRTLRTEWALRIHGISDNKSDLAGSSELGESGRS